MREMFKRRSNSKDGGGKAGSKKIQAFNRIEDLESIINAKNLDIEKKEIQINNLYDKFDSNEIKMQGFVE